MCCLICNFSCLLFQQVFADISLYTCHCPVSPLAFMVNQPSQNFSLLLWSHTPVSKQLEEMAGQSIAGCIQP